MASLEAAGLSQSSSSATIGEVRSLMIQAFINRRIMKKRECVELCKNIHRFLNDPNTVDLTSVIDVINSKLHDLGMKIRTGKMEQDGSEWIGLVNTVKDDAVKKATQLSLAQLEFFKNTISLIVDKDGSCSSDVIINTVCDSMERKLTKRNAQDLLKELTRDHWLCESRRGHYSLGPRSILELLPFLEEITGHEVEECTLCTNRVVQGERCFSCNKKLHTYCIKRLQTSSNRIAAVKCPYCHNEWASSE